jgi:FHA domain/Double zinc ribbon
MDARFYNSEDIDIERLGTDMVNLYISQGYHAQQVGNKDQVLLQLKKGGDFEAIIGMQAAVSLTLQRTAGGVLAMIGQQKWIDKAAVGAVGIVAFPVLWPLALTAGVGTLRQASLGNQVLNMVDGLVRQQRPNIIGGPIPSQLLPHVQNQWGQPGYGQTPAYIPSGQQPGGYLPPPQTVVSALPPVAPVAPKQTLRCPNCNTPYEAGDTFCSGCGRSLAPVKELCPNCNTELKPGTAFCPNCGASTFQGNKSAGTAQTPVYTPPTPPPAQPSRPVPPVYTPPAPSTPVYTPPPAPVYTPPVQPTIEPHAAPTIAAQPVQSAFTKPPEAYYVPPATQNPEVQPPTRINYVQSSTPKPETLPTPQRSQKQYYIPSEQAQQDASQPTIPDQPPVAPKAEKQQPGIDPNFVWGIVSFSDGSQVDLKGERAIVGRSDHDLGGEAPEVDLSQKQASDTVSRIHAVFEHIGSAYTLTDLNSTNATRLNGKRLEPDKAAPLNDGDAVQFGKITATFKKI